MIHAQFSSPSLNMYAILNSPNFPYPTHPAHFPFLFLLSLLRRAPHLFFICLPLSKSQNPLLKKANCLHFENQDRYPPPPIHSSIHSTLGSIPIKQARLSPPFACPIVMRGTFHVPLPGFSPVRDSEPLPLYFPFFVPSWKRRV